MREITNDPRVFPAPKNATNSTHLRITQIRKHIIVGALRLAQEVLGPAVHTTPPLLHSLLYTS